MAALREQDAAIPIVFTQVTDPVGEGLIPNLAHPGGHLTGFTDFEFSIGTKWLEILKQVAPRITRSRLFSTRKRRHSPICSGGRSRPLPRLLRW